MLNQKVRYSIVLSFINQAFENPSQISICEIGSGSRGISEYIRCKRLTLVDKDFKDYSNEEKKPASAVTSIKVEAIKLPLKTNSFDLVFSLDMIEHVHPGDRQRVVREMVRISRKFIIIAFPCGDNARRIDLEQADFLRKYFKKIPGWLEEHLSITYPEAYEIDSILRKLKYKYKTFGNESLTIHRIIQLMELLIFGSSYIEKILPFRIVNFLGNHGSNFYRKVYVIEKS